MAAVGRVVIAGRGHAVGLPPMLGQHAGDRARRTMQLSGNASQGYAALVQAQDLAAHG